MGSFLTNIQIYEKDQAKIRKAIVKSLSTDYEVALPDEKASRSILIKRSENSWSAIYDTALEDQDIDLLYTTAAGISDELETGAISILVHDSDLLNMCLFNNGETINNYWNDPDFLSESIPQYEIEKLKGNPKLWEPFFRKGCSAGDLKKIWEAEETFAEDILQKSVPYFGFSQEDCFLTYQDILDDAEGWEEIRFKQTAEYTVGQPESSLPQMEMTSWRAFEEGAINEPFTISFDFVNSGAEAKGFAVLLYDEAIDNESIGLLGMEIDIRSNDFQLIETVSGDFEEAEVTGDEQRKVYVCSFPDTILPQGRESHRINARIKSVFLKKGEFELSGIIIPHSNDEEGRTGFFTSIRCECSTPFKLNR